MKQQINTRIFFIALFILFVCNSQGAELGGLGGSSATNTQPTTINPTDNETSVGTQAAAANVTNPFLWRIETAGGKPCYAFGSIHLPDKRVTNWPKPLKEVFRIADAVYFEIPFDQQTLAKAAESMCDPDQSLTKALPPDLYSRAEARLKQIAPAMKIQLFDRLSVTAFVAQLLVLEGADPSAVPMDLLVYRQMANLPGKTVGGLETVEEQSAAFNCLTQPEALEYLRSTMDYMDACKQRGTSVCKEMINAYLGGDLQQIMASYNGSMKGCTESTVRKFNEALLTNRNRRLAERIVKKMREHPEQKQIFVLRVAHYAEPDGVLEFLRKEGFKTERVTSLQ